MKAYTRDEAIALYARVRKWSDTRQSRIREEILVPVFGGNDCVRHNSMLAWEEGRPWPCLLKRFGNYHALGRRYQYLGEQRYQTADRLASHFAKFF